MSLGEWRRTRRTRGRVEEKCLQREMDFMSVIVTVPTHMDNTPLTTHRVRRVPPFSPFPSLPLLTWYCGMLSFPVMRSRLMLSCFIIGALPCPSGHRPAPYPVSSRSLATSPTHLSPSCPRIRSKVVKRWWYLKRGERSVLVVCVCMYAGVLLAYSMCSTVDASSASHCPTRRNTTQHDTRFSLFRLFSFASSLSPPISRRRTSPRRPPSSDDGPSPCACAPRPRAKARTPSRRTAPGAPTSGAESCAAPCAARGAPACTAWSRRRTG